jgi:hypothetical protein
MKFMHASWFALRLVMPFILEIGAPRLCLKGCLFCEQTLPPLLGHYSTLIVYYILSYLQELLFLQEMLPNRKTQRHIR